MSALSDLQAAHKRMVQLFADDDWAAVIESAREVPNLARSVKDERVMRAAVTSAVDVSLISRASLEPDEPGTYERCERAIAQFRGLDWPEAPATVIIAYGVQLELLLRTRRVSEAEAVAGQLVGFYRELPIDPESVAEDAEVVRIVSNMIAMEAPLPAIDVARVVVDRLAGTAGSPGAGLAAMAQTWIVLALAFDQARPSGFTAPQSAGGVRALLEADSLPPELAPIETEIDRLTEMGREALEACEQISGKLNGERWAPARAFLASLKIATLEALGDEPARSEAVQALVESHADSSDAGVRGVVSWFERHLGSNEHADSGDESSPAE